MMAGTGVAMKEEDTVDPADWYFNVTWLACFCYLAIACLDL